MHELTDEELDRYVETRLRIIGVDLSVLPEDDPDAPADRVRIFGSARGFLRGTVPALSAYELDPQLFPPMSYPAMLAPAIPSAFPAVGEVDHGE
ncbi:MAG: hypothetical protein EA350_05010 [Gemmatimonadales bacterium]|nr:MAG: hypothetical protein EA350_05010 [Gemmatimonadales bacterium]